MKSFRRRAYVRVCGLRLKRKKSKYYFYSNLSVAVHVTAEGTKGERDDTIFNTVSQLKGLIKSSVKTMVLSVV